MELIKCGKKGQITIPREIIKTLGLNENTPMLIELSDDGAIVLRHAAVVPIEMYSDARISEFELEGLLSPNDLARGRAILPKAA